MGPTPEALPLPLIKPIEAPKTVPPLPTENAVGGTGGAEGG